MQLGQGQLVAVKVADISAGVKDGRGEIVDYVYFKRDDYAIYRCGDQIIVAYSDNTTTANQQIADVSTLLPLRDHLINLIRDIPSNGIKNNCLCQIADALRLAIEKQPEPAKAVLAEAIQNALDIQARIGRMMYLRWASALALSLALVLIPVGGAFVQHRSGVHLLLMATGAGALGALLSIAVAIRGRSIAIDGNWRANAMDAAVRVLIGIISACILFLVLSSGLVTDLAVGNTLKLSGGDITWQGALVIGFVAGFVERLVPDLLEKEAPLQSQNSPQPPPTSTSGVVSPTGGAAGGG